MIPAKAETGSTESIELTATQFSRIATLAKANWGLDLDPAKAPLVRARLSRRVKAMNCSDFDQYCAVVEKSDAAERDHFISALTTNVTQFYREPHHFETLETEVLPALSNTVGNGGRIRIWSAGCSSGEEPYSIAGSVFAKIPNPTRFDLKILATDIDPNVITKAKSGSYAGAGEDTFEDSLGKRLFTKPKGGSDTSRQIKSDLQSLITFQRLNLIGNWPMTGKFDVIFCRNVAIYFDKPTQAKLWSRFCDILKPGGFLFIGHSERIADPAGISLSPAGITTYKRLGGE